MSSADPRIEPLLATLKASGRSSPKGIHWHRFVELLRANKQPGQSDPPPPFILGASGESDAKKHTQLGRQLEWAFENGCLDEAIRYLESVPADQWNSSPVELWSKEFHPF